MMRRWQWCGLALVGVVSVGCGGADLDPPSDSVEQPVVGGTVDDADTSVVGLAVSGSSIGLDFFFGHCTGTLIAPNLVLTARHCVALTQDEGPQGSVVCGQTGFGFQAGGAMFRVTTATTRPGQDGPEFYRGTGSVKVPENADDICGNDIALIILEGAGIPEDVATPTIPRIDSRPEPGETFSAIGYGLTDPNNQESSGTRMRLDGNEVTCLGGTCSGFFGDSVKESEWLGTASTCPGDSGGPAIDTQNRVTGVLSRGPQGCLSSVYGDVAQWKDMITEAALEAAQMGGYDPPFWVTTGSSTPPPPPPEPEPDPLGRSCNGDCPAGYACVTPDGTNPICTPLCSAASSACPTGYTCDSGVGACMDDDWRAEPAGADSDGGCRMAGPAKPVPWIAVGALLGLWVARRRRRR